MCSTSGNSESRYQAPWIVCTIGNLEAPDKAPTTLTGLLALLSYIEGVSDGYCSPHGKPDIVFQYAVGIVTVTPARTSEPAAYLLI